MRLFLVALVPALAALGPGHAAASAKLVEPALHIQRTGAPAARRVAITLDACGGRTDQRILSTLVENRIPATIFITARWLKRNQPAFAVLRAHPDLFELEDHGARHIPAIDQPVKVYGIAAAGSVPAVKAEVQGGAEALAAAGAPPPKWFRGATARYTPSSVAEIRQLGFEIAGYSLNADGGATFSAATTEKRLDAAKDGDVVIAHINQPTRSAGAGVAKGLLDLKAKGVAFARLSDVAAEGTDGTTGTAAF